MNKLVRIGLGKYILLFCFSIILLACNEKSLDNALKNPEPVEKLDLINQNITDFPAGIEELRNLTHLYLNLNQLKSVSPKIGKLKKLRILNLNNNQLKDLPPEIGDLENLESLSLINNKLTELPEGLIKLKKLKYLNLSNNLISPDEQIRIKQNLPLTEIHFEFASQLKNPKFYFAKALEEYQKTNYSNALEYCNKTIDFSTNIGEAYSLRGYLKLVSRDSAGACSDWGRAIELGDKQAQELSKKFCK